MTASFHVFPVRHSVLQGPLENDLVVHVALVAESQRYEVRVGGAFLWGPGGGLSAFCYSTECGRSGSFQRPLDGVLRTSSVSIDGQLSVHV